jgi:hypothetical protein
MSALPKEQTDLEVATDYIDDTFGKTSDFIVEPAIIEAANDQVPSTLFGKIYAFFDNWSQHSYDAWEKSGRPIVINLIG